MSPTIIRHNGVRYFFFSREESRMHVHVSSGDGEAKFWLEPELELARNFRYTKTQLRVIELFIKEHQDEFISAWRQYFKS